MKLSKNIALIICLVMCFTLVLTACGVKTHTVTFDLNYTGAAVATTATVNDGDKASEPNPAPVRTGYIFSGWYITAAAAAADKYDFAAAVTGNLTLYAGWAEDAAQADPYPNAGTIIKSLEGNTYKLDIYDSRVSKIVNKATGEFIEAFQNYNSLYAPGIGKNSIVFGEWRTGAYEYLEGSVIDNALTIEYESDTLKLEDHNFITSYTADESNILLELGGHTEVKVSLEKNGCISSYFNAGGTWRRTNMGFWTISQSIPDDYTSASVTFDVYMDGVKADSGVNDANRIYADVTAKIATFSRSGIVTQRQVLWVPALLNASVPLFEFISAGGNVAQLYLGGIEEEQPVPGGEEGETETVTVGNLLKLVNPATKATIAAGEWAYSNTNNRITLTINEQDYVPVRDIGQWSYNTLEFDYNGETYSTEIINWESLLLDEWEATLPTGVVSEKITGRSSSGASNIANYTLTLYGNNRAYFYGETNDGVITVRGAGTYTKGAESCTVTINDREFGEFEIKFNNTDGNYIANINLDEAAGLTGHTASSRIFGNLTLSFSNIDYTFQGLATGGNLNNTVFIMSLRANGTLELKDRSGASHNAYGTYTYDEIADSFEFVIRDSTSNIITFEGASAKVGNIYQISYTTSGSTVILKWEEAPTATGVVFTGPGPYSQTIIATLYSDGTIIVSVGALGSSSGCWVYDAETNVYSYSAMDANGDGNGRTASSTYNETTNTYTLTYMSMSVAREITYTPIV